MTTLGFGDIIFTSDLGRMFSIVVLLSGVFLLLVMLPFLFIRLFYAPWLEARVRLRAPRRVPAGTRRHVILTEYDAIASGLIERLRGEGIPYFVIEPDPATAARLVGEGVSVVAGENDSSETYVQVAAPDARLLLANCEDTTNTNVTITAREIAPDLPIAAIVEEDDSVDILELSGATTVLPLKRQLGEYLANRVDVRGAEAHVIGTCGTLQIAELPARDTPFAGLTVRDTRLRERAGVSVVGLWQRGRLQPAFADTIVHHHAVLVVAGNASQIATLNGFLTPGEGPAPSRARELRVELYDACRRRRHVPAARPRARAARRRRGAVFSARAAAAGGPSAARSGIGSKTGMSVVALQYGDSLQTQLTAETILAPDATLLLLGSLEQRRVFGERFEMGARR